MNESFRALEDLWTRADGAPEALERVTLTGADPILPTDFKIGTAASATIAAGALAASEIWRLRTGRSQSVRVDLRRRRVPERAVPSRGARPVAGSS